VCVCVCVWFVHVCTSRGAWETLCQQALNDGARASFVRCAFAL